VLKDPCGLLNSDMSMPQHVTVLETTEIDLEQFLDTGRPGPVRQPRADASAVFRRLALHVCDHDRERGETAEGCHCGDAPSAVAKRAKGG
jgi:hypothetical protein